MEMRLLEEGLMQLAFFALLLKTIIAVLIDVVGGSDVNRDWMTSTRETPRLFQQTLYSRPGIESDPAAAARLEEESVS